MTVGSECPERAYVQLEVPQEMNVIQRIAFKTLSNDQGKLRGFQREGLMPDNAQASVGNSTICEAHTSSRIAGSKSPSSIPRDMIGCPGSLFNITDML